MSAAELRQAAEAERVEWGGEQNARQFPTSSALHLALADALDAGVAQMQADDFGRPLSPLEYSLLALARLINDGAS